MKHDESEPEFLSIPKVAIRLDVSTRTVRRWIERAELPFYRVGSQLRIAGRDLEIFLKLRREG